MKQEKEDYRYMVAVRCMTYNQAPYIGEALRGFAMQQTSFPVVNIIVDDASTDGEQNVINNWVEKNLDVTSGEAWRKMPYGLLAEAPLRTNSNSTFVILLLSENHYQTGRKNKRVDYIREWYDAAKYHSLCEGDDYWISSAKLQKQVEMLECNPGYGMVYTPYIESNQVTGEKKEVRTSPRINHDDRFKWDILEQNVMIGTCTVIIRSELESTIKGIEDDFRGFLLGDTQTWFNAARLSKVGYLEEPTGVYRKIPTGMTATFDQSRRSRFIRSCLDAHLHLAYKYGAPTKTIKVIKDRFGIYCFNLYLRQHDYDSARAMNEKYFNNSWLYSCSITVAKVFKLNKLQILGPLHHLEAKVGLINLK